MSYHFEGSYYGRPYLYDIDQDLGSSELWYEFADKPGIWTKFKTYWLKWELEKSQNSSANPSYGYRPQYKIACFYSQNEGKSWTKFNTYDDRKKPFYREIVGEAIEAKKDFFKARNRERARARREKLLAEANKKGMDPAELQKLQSEERQKKIKKKRETKKAKSLAKDTNKKMKIASTLKDLLDVANDLQEKLLNGTSLNLAYVDNRIHKVEDAKRILEEWARPKKKS